MVKIEHNKTDLAQFAADHYTALRLQPYEIEAKLQEFTRNAGTHAPTQHAIFTQLLATHLKTLITGWPEELEKLKPSLVPALDAVLNALPSSPPPAKINKKIEDYKKALEQVFDYKKFTRNYSEYGAYNKPRSRCRMVTKKPGPMGPGFFIQCEAGFIVARAAIAGNRLARGASRSGAALWGRARLRAREFARCSG